jgi:trigger factor
MKFEKKQEKNKITYTFTVDKKEFDDFYETTLTELSKQVKVDGFRENHVPKDIAEKHIDPSAVLYEAAEKCIRHYWLDTAQKEDIQAIDQPRIELIKVAKGDELQFTVEYETLPEIKLPEYAKIAKTVKSDEVKVEEQEYKNALNWLLQSRAKIAQKEGKSKKGDLIEITYHAKDIEDDKEKKDRFVLGKGHYIKGLEDGLIGLEKGEEKKIDVPHPQEKDKTITLDVKVESVQTMDTPKLDDEFAKSVGFKDQKELEKNIKDGLTQEKEMAEKQRKRTEVLEKIAKETKVDLPECLVERENNGLLENLKNRVTQELRISFDDYLKEVKKTEEEIKEEFKKIAEQRVVQLLVLAQIEKQEDIKVSEKEIKDKINELASQYPDKEQALKEMESSNAKFYVEDELKREKIFNILGC